MIAREWHGMTSVALADEYQDYIFKTGLPGLKSVPGNLGVMVLRRFESGRVHFLLISYWDSYDAIRKFTGAEIEKARYYPDDEKYLIEMEPLVRHYEIVAGQEIFQR
jgi:heme-degrading monooxygenase HmoA